MQHLKTLRAKNTDLIEFIKKECPCVICARQPVDAHHVKSKKSGGDDIVHNLMPLCRNHHQELHKKGLSFMADRYNGVLIWLQAANWTYDDYLLKWVYNEKEEI